MCHHLLFSDPSPCPLSLLKPPLADRTWGWLTPGLLLEGLGPVRLGQTCGSP